MADAVRALIAPLSVPVDTVNQHGKPLGTFLYVWLGITSHPACIQCMDMANTVNEGRAWNRVCMRCDHNVVVVCNGAVRFGSLMLSVGLFK